MRAEDVEIITDNELGRPYRSLGPIKARIPLHAVWNKARNLEDVKTKLREVAFNKGATAVISVVYKRGISATSWKALTAQGIAVIGESDAT